MVYLAAFALFATVYFLLRTFYEMAAGRSGTDIAANALLTLAFAVTAWFSVGAL